MTPSPRMTWTHASSSCATIAASAARIWASTTEPIRSTLSLISVISLSKEVRCGWVGGSKRGERKSASRASSSMTPANASATRGLAGVRSSSMSGVLGSAEPAGDVVLGHPALGVGEDLERRTLFHDVPRPVLGHVHEHGTVGCASGLLHVVGHDDDRVVLAQLRHELFDLERGAWVQRRTGFV